MQQQPEAFLLLPAGGLPAALVAWLEAQSEGPLLVAFDRLPNGDWALQALPDVDPTMVARLRRILAQHADVLRRLT
ncbi:MAG: hypothetical protein H0X37_00810 [Herpetosiphonaceae bacterium]|nr:hypothetical protein [Herpetosiphonaceae bacterium]